MKTSKLTIIALLFAGANVFCSAANTLTLTATVTDEYNQPVENAEAVLIQSDTRQVIKATSKSSEGQYVFQGLSSGEYILSISSHDKKQLKTEKVVLKEQNQSLNKNVLMEPETEKVEKTSR